MKFGLYSIKDLKTGYLPISTDHNDNSAIRNFEHACKNTDSLFFTHPSDYQLWKLGTFDSDTGVIEYAAKFLCDAPQVRKEND